MSFGPRLASPGKRAGLVLALAVLLVGCVALLRQAAEPYGFTHRAHLARDLSCEDCHENGTSKEKAGMPAAQTCLDCHEDDAAERAPRQVLKAYAARPKNARYVPGPSYQDVVFAHDRHAGKAGIDCAICHPGVKTGGVASPNGPPRMKRCVACHEEKDAPTSCETCHEKLRKDKTPPSHTPNWQLEHGQVVEMTTGDRSAERCELCHTRSSCDSCHASRPPRSHTPSFRVATHGGEAAMDRSRCIACHRVDSCERCHRSEPPRTHRGSWASGTQRHCVSCHQPIRDEGCAVCHQSAEHRTAPARPANHFSDPSDCRRCHLRPHTDNGDSCLSCHR